MTRTLITGIDGFTGRYLASRLTEQGEEVHGLVRNDGTNNLGIKADLHHGNLLDKGSLARVMDDVRPTRIVHLAAVSSVDYKDVEEIYRVNLFGSRNLLEAASAARLGLSSVLLASSANVYGSIDQAAITEDFRPQPANDYAVSKLAMENVAKLFSSDLPIIIARPFNYTGVGQSARFLVPKIVDHVWQRTDSISLGNLDVWRDWSDVRMVVDAYARLLHCPAAIGGVYNVCSGTVLHLQSILEIACQLGNHRPQVIVDPALVRTNEVRCLVGSKARLESVIGPLLSFDISETISWMLDS